VVITGIGDGYHVKFAWFLMSRRTLVAVLNSIVSKKEQS
jgi:hypothetical protein